MSYKDYERLIAKIVENLGKLQGLTNSHVKHNAQVAGASGASHQIDVLWEFEIEQEKYKTIFQAKDWTEKVTLGAVNTFSGVLRDIADARGVMITRKGYDKGNIEKIAKTYNIQLLRLDEYGNIFKGGSGPRLAARALLQDVTVGISNFKFASEEQAKAFREYSNQVERSEVIFYSQSGKQSRLSEMTRLIEKLAEEKGIHNDGQDLTFIPEEPLFVRTSPEVEVEILAIRALITKKTELLGQASLFVTHILQSATGDQTYYVDDSFKVHRQEKMELILNYRDFKDPDKTRTTIFSVEDRATSKLRKKKTDQNSES
ncbi:MAG: restriction endonuclease [Candidatus Obscuribacterales bacterium]|nr:restriction endonuclease [Candidatus Obscuribacterales bacterium]